MSNDPAKIDSIVSEKRVKLHLFEPSGRKIWTVVGKGEEHWLDPESNFCSCPGYYFGRLSGKNTCYHLDSLMLSQTKKQYEIIRFSDEEFSDFMAGIISEL